MRYVGGPLELSIDLLERTPVSDPAVQLGLAEWDVRWTASGRSGLALVLEQWRTELSGGWLLLPDYLCWDAILPLLKGINSRYVRVNDMLAPDMESLAKFLDDPLLRAVVLVDYFGLCDLHPQLRLIKSRRPDVMIVIDGVQAFFALSDVSNRYPGVDAVVSSPRKVLPLPDGGVVLMAHSRAMPVLSCTARSGERDALFLAAGTLRQATVGGQLDSDAREVAERLYVDLFDRHKNMITGFIESMSPLSAEILRRTNLTNVAEQRSQNIAWLRQAFLEGRGRGICRAAFPEASGPGLAFPVRVSAQHRDPLRHFLRANGYFCPVHWPVSSEAKSILGSEAMCLSSELLSLPVDQRYGENEMNELLDAVERYEEIYK